MSMIVTTVVLDGIVMACDSANSVVTVMDFQNLLKGEYAQAAKNILDHKIYGGNGNTVDSHITSRSFQKLHVMKGNKIAISEGNEWVSRQTGVSIKPQIDHFCLNNNFDNPKAAAMELFRLVRKIDPTMDAKFHVCGYNPDGEMPTPEFWFVSNLESEPRLAAGNGSGGICFSGVNDYFTPYTRLINQNLTLYSLQDAIDVTMWAFDMSMKCERFIDMKERMAPPIDLLVITESGVEWISKKKLGVHNDSN